MIYLIPLILVDEINSGLGFSILPNTINLRSFKEYSMVLIILLSCCYNIFGGGCNKCCKFLFCLLFVLVSVSLNSIGEPFEIFVCGIRWILPIFLPIFLCEFVDRKFMVQFYNALTVIFIIHLFLQFIELFLMPPYNGLTYFGLTARVPGVTSHPHASAYFVCSYYVVMIGFESKKWRKNLISMLSVLSILLSMSSTGVIAISILLLLDASRNDHWKVYLFLAPLMAILLFMNADYITNRSEGSSQTSINGRIDFYNNILENTSLVSDNFGYATNGAFILNKKGIVKNKQIMFADSFYTSILGNLGVLYFLLFVLFLLWLFSYLWIHQYVYPLLFFILCILFAVSDILTEVYPGNIILSTLAAYLLRYPNENRQKRALMLLKMLLIKCYKFRKLRNVQLKYSIT